MTRRPATPPEDYKRKPIPAAVKLQAALINGGGIDPAHPYEFDHDPSLGLRPWIQELQDFEPAELDPHYIVPRQKRDHRQKTAKTDIPAIAKTKRLAKAQRKHFLAMMTPESWPLANAWVNERLADKPKSKWPKRKLRSRGFQKREAHV